MLLLDVKLGKSDQRGQVTNDKMAKKEFVYRGKKLEELQAMSLTEFSQLLKSRARRCIKRGLPDQQKIFLNNVAKGKRKLKTHSREMVVLPQMVGKTIQIHSGKSFVSVEILPEMIGHKLGEFALTRRRVAHSAPGIGATRSSSSLSVR